MGERRGREREREGEGEVVKKEGEVVEVVVEAGGRRKRRRKGVFEKVLCVLQEQAISIAPM